MAEKPSYDNIAKHAWDLIYRRMTRSDPATTFLGPAGTAILRPHFPAGWLDKIKIGTCVGGVPAPVMSDLWRAMGYSDEPSFETACDTIDTNLFSVLSGFTNGALFNGITYDTTIYLKDSEKDELSLVLHELVHSLQWFHFAKTGFLSRYIEGYTNVFPDYERNPAEASAYGQQREFERLANIELGKAGLGPVDWWGGAIRAAADDKGTGNALVAKAIAALKNIPAMGINAVTAPGGMRN